MPLAITRRLRNEFAIDATSERESDKLVLQLFGPA
jgi:hypothetical protein